MFLRDTLRLLILSPKMTKNRGKISVNALIAPNSLEPPAKPILMAVGIVEPNVERVDRIYSKF